MAIRKTESLQIHHCWCLLGGRHAFDVLEMHNKYGEHLPLFGYLHISNCVLGPVVRTAPNELSFNTSKAWQDIHTHRKGHQDLLKSAWYQINDLVAETTSLVSERDPKKHEKTKKYFLHAFSERGLREQQDLVMEIVDLFISQLKQRAERDKIVSLSTWFNMLTFDARLSRITTAMRRLIVYALGRRQLGFW